MAQKWPKIILDPVHRLISFQDVPEDRLVLKLINTKEFQRLRRIKQLGMSEMVFPGSNHSRLAHSIGVMHTARLILQRLERLQGKSYPSEDRAALLSAALLHDIGHGPFSHAFERVTGDAHEDRTRDIILDTSTEVSQTLAAYDTALPRRIAAVFEGRSDESEDPMPTVFSHIVSSQLDADRFDYLLRDSHATGTNYGDFDLQWLIEHLCLDNKNERLYLSRKALLTAEAYVYARHHMYSTVYFHKTTRAAERMLQLLFRRYKDLLHKEKAGDLDVPATVREAFATRSTLQQYLSLDDYTVTEFFKACVRSSDTILASLAVGLVDRKLYKAIDATDSSHADVGRFAAEATLVVQKLGHDPEYALVADSPGDVPYKPYDPHAGKPAEQIYVEKSTGEIVELSTVSEPVRALQHKYTHLRYYCPQAIQSEVWQVASETLFSATRK